MAGLCHTRGKLLLRAGLRLARGVTCDQGLSRCDQGPPDHKSESAIGSNIVHLRIEALRSVQAGRAHARKRGRVLGSKDGQILASDTSPAKALFFREQRDGEGVATFRGPGAKIRKNSDHWVFYTLGVKI